MEKPKPDLLERLNAIDAEIAEALGEKALDSSTMVVQPQPTEPNASAALRPPRAERIRNAVQPTHYYSNQIFGGIAVRGGL